ncbi:hypothetical protein CRYUN_Cryun13aG0079700 [Craigia yunnanensis]
MAAYQFSWFVSQNIASTDEIYQYVVEMSVLIVTCIQIDNPRSSWLSGVLINSDLFAMLLSGLKLIAYDHIAGDPGLDGGKNAPLFIDILNMVCSCVDNSSTDSTILQVLKVLLTAVASTKFRVHGEPLLGVIRPRYNISLHRYSVFVEDSDSPTLQLKIANCIDSTVPAEAVFQSEVKKLQQKQFKPFEKVTLEPFERDHTCVVGGYRMPKKQKAAA